MSLKASLLACQPIKIQNPSPNEERIVLYMFATSKNGRLRWWRVDGGDGCEGATLVSFTSYQTRQSFGHVIRVLARLCYHLHPTNSNLPSSLTSHHNSKHMAERKLTIYLQST